MIPVAVVPVCVVCVLLMGRGSDDKQTPTTQAPRCSAASRRGDGQMMAATGVAMNAAGRCRCRDNEPFQARTSGHTTALQDVKDEPTHES